MDKSATVGAYKINLMRYLPCGDNYVVLYVVSLGGQLLGPCKIQSRLHNQGCIEYNALVHNQVHDTTIYLT